MQECDYIENTYTCQMTRWHFNLYIIWSSVPTITYNWADINENQCDLFLLPPIYFKFAFLNSTVVISGHLSYYRLTIIFTYLPFSCPLSSTMHYCLRNFRSGFCMKILADLKFLNYSIHSNIQFHVTNTHAMDKVTKIKSYFPFF